MTNVSAQQIPAKQQDKLLAELVLMTQSCTSKKAEKILTELLSDSEKIMLVKRLAAIIMLAEGVSQYRVAQTLKLSTASVRTYRVDMKVGRYDTIVATVKNKHFDKKKFFTLLETLLRAGMPPRTGDRWQHVPGFGQ